MEIKSKIEGEMHPIVSIILPVYNAENTIRKCIESVLNQTFREFELIIVNGVRYWSSFIFCMRLSSIPNAIY